MATIFTKIISGELPGRFVWKDDRAVAFLTIHPIRPGHTLVVPRAEVDSWLDLDPALADHLFRLARQIGQAIEKAFAPPRVGLLIAGLEVAHCHLHVLPLYDLGDVTPARQDLTRGRDLDAAADKLRAALGTQVT
jgi:diadenosine tetraphosphate (Ap4A) HIT family hydrolase